MYKHIHIYIYIFAGPLWATRLQRSLQVTSHCFWIVQVYCLQSSTYLASLKNFPNTWHLSGSYRYSSGKTFYPLLWIELPWHGPPFWNLGLQQSNAPATVGIPFSIFWCTVASRQPRYAKKSLKASSGCPC